MKSADATTYRYKRIVAKFGTNVLTGGSDRLDAKVLASLVAQVACLWKAGVQVLVVTSGAIAAGGEALDVSREGKDVPYKQVLAAVGQSRLMARYQALFEQHRLLVGQALITKGDLDGREGYLNVRNTLEGLLDLGVVPIINENDVVDIREIGGAVFGDNDNLSAAVANLVDADLLVILSDIDGLYTADPRRDPSASLIPRVERVDRSIEALAGDTPSKRSRGGMVTKVQAARLATESGTNVVIANGHTTDVLPRLAQGEAIGTFFVATASKVDSRRRWMVSGLGASGAIVVDDGAVKALTEQHRSLLPAGVRSVEGDFERGALVEVRDSLGRRIGCGLTNYGSRELERIKGAKSADIAKLLGYRYGDEAVHRNHLVMLERAPAGA
ncbi:MAG: glutamate 5-kinase [Chloroflexi bacterium]|nr:glutamate 5-kinase [Chloroflexota bacterium]